VGSLCGTWLGGWLSDRVGSGSVQLTSLLGAAVMLLLVGQMHSVWAIATVLFLLSLFADAFRPANATSLARVCPPELRGKAYALLRLGINLGFAIGPTAGGYLAAIDYAWLFRIDAGASLLAAVLFAWWLRHHTPARPVAQATAGPAERTSPLRDRVFLACIACMFLVALVFMQILSTWPLHLRDHYQLGEKQYGWLLAVNALLIVGVEMVLVHVLRGRRPLRVVALGALLIGTGFGLTGLGNSLVFAAFTVVIWTVGEMLESPLLMAFVSGRAGERSRGSYMGLYMLAWSIALLLAPVVGTSIWQDLGPNALWSASFASCALAAGGFLLIDRRLRR